MDAKLLTVWHTSTKYHLKGLEKHYAKEGGRASYSHLNDAWKRKAEAADIVYTTYRDPLKVAASWANRGHFLGKGTKVWMEQWGIFKELEEINPIVLMTSRGRWQAGIEFPEKPINTYPDKLGLHEAIAEDNMKYFYRKVPRFAVEYAIECSEWVDKGE